jgi:hypothetical protein
MKSILIFLSFLAIISPIKSQVIKVQAGPSFSKLNWKITDKKYDRTEEGMVGNSVFIGIDYLFRDKYNVSTNFGYLQKGGTSELRELNDSGAFTGNTFSYNPILEYYSFNTCIDINYKRSDKVWPYFFAGPHIDYIKSYSTEFDYYKNINELEEIAYGVLMGVGLKINISKLQIALKGDYYFNFTKIASWKDSATVKKGEISDDTFTVMLSVGYRLN